MILRRLCVRFSITEELERDISAFDFARGLAYRHFYAQVSRDCGGELVPGPFLLRKVAPKDFIEQEQWAAQKIHVYELLAAVALPAQTVEA